MRYSILLGGSGNFISPGRSSSHQEDLSKGRMVTGTLHNKFKGRGSMNFRRTMLMCHDGACSVTSECACIKPLRSFNAFRREKMKNDCFRKSYADSATR